MREGNKRAKEREQELTAAYTTVFRSDAGAKVLKDLMRRFHMYKSTAGIPVDVNELILREGERNALLYIIDRLNLTPDEIEDRFREIKSDIQWLIDEERNDSDQQASDA